MNQPCDCCEGPLAVTPAATANRPGLNKLAYRVGTHATFLETMQARLSSVDHAALRTLRTRERSDPTIALLDAWATVADVLTFYQERIANEGYLRTATERRSVLELARLVGYALRPGVAASVYLAYALDKDAAPVAIPSGALANSVPAPGEQMQAFETAEPLLARYEWNAMKPRLTKPQTFADVHGIHQGGLYFKGISTKLRPNDPLIIKTHPGAEPELVYVASVTPDSDNDRTRVTLVAARAQLAVEAAKAVVEQFARVGDFNVPADSAMSKRVLALLMKVWTAAGQGPQQLFMLLETVVRELGNEAAEAREKHYTNLQPWVEGMLEQFTAVRELLGEALTQVATASATGGSKRDKVGALATAFGLLKVRPSIPPANATQLHRSAADAFSPRAAAVPPRLEVFALRVMAAPFGHNAPLRLEKIDRRAPVMGEWQINNPLNEAGGHPKRDHHEPLVLYLDNDYEIPFPDRRDPERSNTFVVIDRPAEQPSPVPLEVEAKPARRISVAELGLNSPPLHRSLTAYGLSGKTVRLQLPDQPHVPEDPGRWLTEREVKREDTFGVVRDTRVFAGSERMDLAEAPIADDVAGCEIELGELHAELKPGRWLIVAGERADITTGAASVGGVTAAELVMITKVEHRSRAADNIRRPGDRLHTFVTLAECLAYRYKRDTVTIYGNVVKATHGETRREVLGSGDATKTFQTFSLRQSPLTFVSASTVSGIDSTLQVRVNDVQWHEAEGLAVLGPKDRKFLTRTDDDGKTSVVFGDGERGVRLPTGIENVKAIYRSGIGKPGNVKAGQITLLGTRPLGVKEVTNPIRASGGADRESRDRARKNAPLALIALDRLVSTADYAAFSRTFAGIGKAAAWRGLDGEQQFVKVVIAGSDDIPIELTSDLYRNLFAALHRFGDPFLPIELIVRKRLALVISANIKINPDYQWETLEPKIRAALLDRFSFESTDLGQDVLLSDAIDAIQAVRGVIYVDVDVFDKVSEEKLIEGFIKAIPLRLQSRIAISPEQIAYLLSDVADTLILQEAKT
jgi:predicted phage baseplate assembly protein